MYVRLCCLALSYRLTFASIQKDTLWTLDTRAINHILTHSTDYQKPESLRKGLAQLLGEGVLFTEGKLCPPLN